MVNNRKWKAKAGVLIDRQIKVVAKSKEARRHIK